MVIHPYKESGTWMFDDNSKELMKEPFVAGMPRIIEFMTDMNGIKNAEDGFTALFSNQPFPDTDLELKWVREEYGGNWYKIKLDTILNKEDEWEGWLCPALMKYFDKVPKEIYVKVENLTEA